MVGVIFILIFGAVMGLILGVALPSQLEARLKFLPALDSDDGMDFEPTKPKKFSILRHIAFFNRPLCVGYLGQRMAKDLAMAHLDWSPEEFLLIKEFCIVGFLAVSYPSVKPDLLIFWIGMSFALGYMFPEFFVRNKIHKAKQAIIRELPDTVDLLALCVNAGLDFMLAMKWVVEKSRPSILVSELKLVMQEINVGKPRREALSDLAKKYETPDLSTFSRTLIQADRMGTSVAEALNILSEDMRAARFRRGEQIALKSPLKMLVPLMLFIFPVVGVLVMAPVFLDFLSTGVGNAVGASILGQK